MADGKCPPILVALEGYTRENTPETKVTPAGTLAYLKSPINDTVVVGTNSIDQGNGHKRNVTVQYRQRGIPSETQDDPNCDPVAPKLRIETTVPLTLYRQDSITIDYAYYRELCSEASARNNGILGMGVPNSVKMNEIAREVFTRINALHGAVEGDVLGQIAANFGINVTTGDALAKSIPVLKAADGSPVSKGYQILLDDYMKNEGMGRPNIIGSGLFNRANIGLGWGCCNDGGTDFGRMQSMAQYNYWHSLYVDSIIGQDELIVLQPNVAQFISFNENRGNFENPQAQKFGNSTYTTIPDPIIPGLFWDLQIKERDCANGEKAKEVDIFISLAFDVFFIPSDAYQVGDRLEGVNGLFRYLATEV